MRAVMIGELARRALSDGATGKVMGVTSKGMFLAAGERILFVTDADYKSPFNIQVPEYTNAAAGLEAGETWRFDSGELIFGSQAIRIDIGNAQTWQLTPPPEMLTSISDQLARMEGLLRRTAAIDPSKGWLFLAVPSASNGLGDESEGTRIRRMTADFLNSVKREDLEGSLEQARSILGRGGGLTPSGDDWLSGFLLYHARSGGKTPFLRDLETSLTAMAIERTTKISANRIEAVCQGRAEELFLEVIDHLFDPQREFSDLQVKRLVNFGHSSGVDTCVGIWAALAIN